MTRQDERLLIQATADGGVEDVVLPPADEEEARFETAFDTVLSEHHDALPARGLLVTTLVFVRTGPVPEYGVLYDPDPELRIQGPSEFATGPILATASKVAIEHRNWLRAKRGTHRLADRRAIDQAKTKALPKGRRDPDQYDFVKYLVDLFLQSFARNPTWVSISRERLHDHIDQVLDKGYSAVRKRRERAQLSTNVPRRWREQARSKILAAIETWEATK
jgi:hypothetical protein